MTYHISPFEIDNFKTELLQTENNSCLIADKINLWLDSYIQDCLKPNYVGETLYHAPFKTGEGVALVADPNTSWEVPLLQIDPVLLEGIAKMAEELENIGLRMERLESMHSGVIAHIPEIISTREQYEEMKPRMNKEDRVIVHTTFDKALSVL